MSTPKYILLRLEVLGKDFTVIFIIVVAVVLFCFLAELGLALKVSPDGGQHWQVLDRDGRIAEWWPQTGRFVALGNYRRPQKFHDVLGFVGAVRRGRRA
jgi:hypothetical protein